MHLVGCRRAPQPSRHAQPHGCRRWLPEPALHLSPARRPSASRPAGVSPASLQEVDNSQVVNRLFIFGLGYTGLALARYVLQQCRPEAAPPGGGGTGGPRWHVAATCRSASKLLDGAAGLDGVHLFDFDPGAKVLLSDEGRAALQVGGGRTF